jgi:hypothetical protein
LSKLVKASPPFLSRRERREHWRRIYTTSPCVSNDEQPTVTGVDGKQLEALLEAAP